MKEEQNTICFSPESMVAFRKKYSLSRRILGNLLNVSGGTIRNWEKGYLYPDADYIDKISILLNLNKEEFDVFLSARSPVDFRKRKDNEKKKQGEIAKRIGNSLFSPELLRSFRKEKGISQRTLSRLLGVTQITIVNWENGKCPPQTHHLDSIRHLVNLDKKEYLALLAEKVPKVYAKKKGLSYSDETYFSPKRLVEFRKKFSLRQRDLAVLLSVSRTTVNNWENSTYAPRSDQIETINHLLNLNEDEFLVELRDKVPEAEAEYRALAIKETTKRIPKNRFSPKNVILFRRKNSISRNTLAKLLGVTKTTIFNWETGKCRPKDNQIEALRKLRKLGEKEIHALLEERDPNAFELSRKNELKASVSRQLRALRTKYNLTQKTLAHLLGVSLQSLASWEVMLRCPNQTCVEEINRIATLSDKEIENLLAEKDPKFKSNQILVNLLGSEQIRALRARYHITQEMLASLLGVGQCIISLWENGKVHPRIEKLEQLNELSKLGIDEIQILLHKKSSNHEVRR